jgi:hypothetical protein
MLPGLRRYYWLERLTMLAAICFAGYAATAVWLWIEGKSASLAVSLAMAGVSALLAGGFYRLSRELRARNPDPRISRKRRR